jgi:hypothetical protein
MKGRRSILIVHISFPIYSGRMLPSAGINPPEDSVRESPCQGSKLPSFALFLHHFLHNLDTTASRFNAVLILTEVTYGLHGNEGTQKLEKSMTLIVLGLLLGIVELIWIMAIPIINADRHEPSASRCRPWEPQVEKDDLPEMKRVA